MSRSEGPRYISRAVPCCLMGLLAMAAIAGCQSPPRPMPAMVHQLEAEFPIAAVPEDVRRVAVFYPRIGEHEWAHAYGRLEQAVFQLKRSRPGLRVLDRREAQRLADERWLQVSGEVSDETAVRLGRLVGADSIIFFGIQGPGWRERLLARMYGTMPPIMVSSRIVRVESAEVVYHDVVMSAPAPEGYDWSRYASDVELRPAVHAALDRGVSEAIVRLKEAFR